MERRSRNILVVLIVLVIAVAVFSSFGLELYAGGVPEITLPTLTPAQSVPESLSPGDGGGEVVRVGVTEETVQGVIASLERPVSYARELTVTYSSTGAVLSARQWVDRGWTRAETRLPGGQVRHSIVGDGMLYYWYGGSQTWYAAPLAEGYAEAETVHIPEYEDVLDVPAERILHASYREKNGIFCICVAVADENLDGETWYWVSADDGLLVAAERLLAGETVLSMSATAAEQPVPAGTQFALPDGTVLHTARSAEMAFTTPAPSE